MQEDFTQRQILEEYKKIVDSSYIVTETDLRGVITYVNETFVRISGYSQEELLGKSHNIVRDPSVPKETFKEMWQTIKSKKRWSGILPNRAKNGKRYIVDATIAPILDPDGTIIKYIAFRTDITQLLAQKQQELSSSIQKALLINQEDLLATIPLPSAIVDEASALLHVNKAFKQFFEQKMGKEDLLENYFVEKEGYISKDLIVDWKSCEFDACSMFNNKVLIELHGYKQEFLLHTKKLEENKFIVSLSPLAFE